MLIPTSLTAVRQTPALRLEGAWEASHPMGPALRGALTMNERNGALIAEIGGHKAACTQAGQDLQANFGPNLGHLRAHIRQGKIAGFWIQPSGVLLNGEHATPFVLERRGDHVWTGAIHPLEDSFTLYLVVQRAADGKLTGFFRNPERNMGRFVREIELTQQGDLVTLTQKRRQDKDRSTFAQGRYDPANNLLTLQISDYGASFDFTRLDTGSSFYPRPASEPYQPPIDRADGWQVADAATQGLDKTKIEAFVQDLAAIKDDSVHSLDIHAVLLARHGKLVLEQYFHGFHAERPHDLRSAAKSLTSMLAGIAMQESPTLRLDSKVWDIMSPSLNLSGADDRKRKITVQNLLTMSSGLDCDDSNDNSPGNEDAMQSQDKDPNYYHFTLNLPMAFDPGSKAVYGSAQPNLLGGVIAEDRKVWLPDYFDEKLARPLGIHEYGMPLSPDGSAYMGGGLFLKPRDFLKFGQVMLNGGTWRGKRILNQSYVQDSFKPRYELEGVHYGYLWWGIDYTVGAQKIHAYYAAGNGGQLVMVLPQLDMVFECLAGNYSDGVFLTIQREFVPKYVLPMVKS